MDYLIQVISSRSQNGDISSTTALAIDEELKPLHVAKNINILGRVLICLIGSHPSCRDLSGSRANADSTHKSIERSFREL